MARILSIQFDLPEPTFGGRKRVFHLTQALAEAGHEVHLLVAVAESGLPRLQPLEAMGVRCHPVFFRTPRERDAAQGVLKFARKLDAAWRFRRASLRAIADPMPRVTKAHWIAPLRRSLRELVESERFDLVIVENEESALLAHGVARGVPVLIDVQNVLSSMAAREVALQPFRDRFDLHRLSERAQPSKLRRFERSMLRRYNAVVAMSEREAQALREIAPEFASRVHVVENGVDVQSYTSTRPSPGHDRLVFTGLMSYYPNSDAMLWFAREVWPLIVRAQPQARLDIVGADPPPEVRALADDARICVTGRVEQVQPYLENADVVIVPLRRGGGTRLKILEAAAMQRPVVSTRVGAEGLDDLRDGQHLLLRDTPQEFAHGVVTLLQDREQSRRLGNAARKVVEAHYDWTEIGRKFEHLVGLMADEGVEKQ